MFTLEIHNKASGSVKPVDTVTAPTSAEALAMACYWTASGYLVAMHAEPIRLPDALREPVQLELEN